MKEKAQCHIIKNYYLNISVILNKNLRTFFVRLFSILQTNGKIQ